MSSYLAQWNIGDKMAEADESGDTNQGSTDIIVEVFTLLYYNFLFMFSVVLALVIGVVLGNMSLDLFLITAFVYPMLDIDMVRRFELSPAALPVALFLAGLHSIGKATWVGITSIEINRPPIIEEWFNSRKGLGN